MAKFTDEEYRHALEVVNERGSYHLQRRNPKTGVWRIIGKAIQGRSAANEVLNRAKSQKRDGESEKDFRVLPKPECDAYAQGLAAGSGQTVGEDRGERRARTRRPLVFLPEHL